MRCRRDIANSSSVHLDCRTMSSCLPCMSGEPNNIASSFATSIKPARASLVWHAVPSPMTSHLESFNSRPMFLASRRIKSTSVWTTEANPPTVTSSRNAILRSLWRRSRIGCKVMHVLLLVCQRRTKRPPPQPCESLGLPVTVDGKGIRPRIRHCTFMHLKFEVSIHYISSID